MHLNLWGIFLTVFMMNVLPSLLYFIDRNERWLRLVNKKFLLSGNYNPRVKVLSDFIENCIQFWAPQF